jgi:hypothetical protein
MNNKKRPEDDPFPKSGSQETRKKKRKDSDDDELDTPTKKLIE